jgi:lipopolysaccharide/colanic/teichoic acid biosynthesis glycosyltransferase
MTSAVCPPSLSRPPTTLYTRYGKRLIDIVLSACGLVILLPLFACCAAMVKCNARGPVLYRQSRVGLNGRAFKILKFRSMRVDSDRNGLKLTVENDKRITSAGKILRKTKLDELPQLLNVLKGDMSLVGPRPEVLKYVNAYNADQLQVLTVKPGITDPASIIYRHEESLLAAQPDPESFYVHVHLPAKLQVNLSYLPNISFTNDLRIILQTVKAVMQFGPKHPLS